MKKFIISLCLTVLTVIFVAGCGSNDSTSKNSKNNWVEVKSITYYLNRESSYTATQYTLSDVKVKFLDNNCLEINTGESTLRIFPLSYTITY